MNFPLVLADPITLTALGAAAGGLAGIGGLATQLFAGKPAAPTAPAPAAPVQSPVGSPNTNANAGPSFLAAAAAPTAGQTSNKSLLGQ